MRGFLKYLILFVGLIFFVISTSALEAKVAYQGAWHALASS
jgi:hypothetical protein